MIERSSRIRYGGIFIKADLPELYKYVHGVEGWKGKLFKAIKSTL